MDQDIKVVVDVRCVVSHNAAIAHATYLTNNDFDFDVVRASGTAVRHPDDKFIKDVAQNLAIGRALESLGKKLQKRGNGVVKQNADNAARKERQKADTTKTFAKNTLGKFRRGG